MAGFVVGAAETQRRRQQIRRDGNAARRCDLVELRISIVKTSDDGDEVEDDEEEDSDDIELEYEEDDDDEDDEEEDDEEEDDDDEDSDDDQLSEDELSKLTIPALKEKLKDAGLPVSGKKAELIARLLTH